MNEQKAGAAVFGLNLEKMVEQAWRVFLSRPLTLLGVACLVLAAWLPTHILGLPSFFWLPFTLCVPFASVCILRNEKSDRTYLGWVEMYPRTLAVFLPAALVFLFLFVVCGFFHLFVVQVSVEKLPRRMATMLYWSRFFLPVLAESILGHTLALAALIAVRKKISATDALFELFATRRHTVEAFLLGGTLALFGMSGALVCCVGIFATTTFAWICLGVAYYQMFEE